MLWINGTKVLEYSGTTMNSATESAINGVYLMKLLSSAIMRQHMGQFGSRILSDSLQNTVNSNWLDFRPPYA